MTYKICTKCKQKLSTNDFYKQSKSKDGLYSYCKKCSYETHKQFCKNYPEKMREYNRASWHRHREAKLKGDSIRANKRRALLDTLKTPCVKCGETRVWCIQFHHRNPKEKRFTIAEGGCLHKPLNEVKEEIKKTVCLCANCHKEFHYFYGIKSSTPVEDLNEYLNLSGAEDE